MSWIKTLIEIGIYRKEWLISRPLLWSTLSKFNYYPVSVIKPQDLVVVGFPKSGSTWMQNLIASLYYGINPLKMPDRLVQEIVVDIHYKKFYKRFGKLSFFKSHHFPHKDYKQVIHIVRNPSDVVNSYINFLSIDPDKNEKKKEEILGSWASHTKQWLSNPYNSKILRIRYEDLIHQPLQELIRICDFISLNYSILELEEIIRGNSFEEMKKRELNFGFDNSSFPSNQNFFNKGQFNSEQLSHDLKGYEQYIVDICKNLGYS